MVTRKDLIASIQARIDAGEWLPGERLPTTSQLMREYEVSQSTVAIAMSHLALIGVIVGHQGGARYVAGGQESDDPGEFPANSQTRDLGTPEAEEAPE